MSDDPWSDYPWLTVILILSNVGVAAFVTGFFPGPENLESVQFSRGALAEGAGYTLLVSLFAHAGILHLAFNMLALAGLGPLIELGIGREPFFYLYVGAGVAGNLVHALTTGEPVVGASGGIFGLLGLLMLNRPRFAVNVLFIFEVPVLVFGAVYTALVPFLLHAADFIAHFAHLGGMFAGLATAFFVNPRRAMAFVIPGSLVFGAVILFAAILTGILASPACPMPGRPALFGYLACVGQEFWTVSLGTFGLVASVLVFGGALGYLESAEIDVDAHDDDYGDAR